MKFIHYLLCIAFFTASCDIVLSVQVGGAVRLAQMLLVVIILAALGRIMQQGRVLWPRGATALVLWAAWQGCCVPLAGTLSLALQFYVLLVFTVVSWIAIVQLYGESDWVAPLMRAYLWSYIVIAIYGAMQFFGPLLFHVTMPYTQQWLLHGRVARISAFTYEPSYYASYMFLGYIMFLDLWSTRAQIVQSRAMRWGGAMVVLTLVLSTSKTAWLCVIFDAGTRLAPRVWRRARYTFGQLRFGRFPLPIPGVRTVLFLCLGVTTVVGVAIAIFVLLPEPLILLAGTGLGGTPAHSFVERNRSVMDTIEVIRQSPLIGRSMGGVPVAIGALTGREISTMAQVREAWGFPVLLDVFAASGLIGFIPFAVFLWVNTFGAIRMARQYMSLECGKWLHALARAMILEWVMLLADQNLFRVYLWFHFSMVTLLMYYVEYGRHAVEQERSAPAAAGLVIVEGGTSRYTQRPA